MNSLFCHSTLYGLSSLMLVTIVSFNFAAISRIGKQNVQSTKRVSSLPTMQKTSPPVKRKRNDVIEKRRAKTRVSTHLLLAPILATTLLKRKMTLFHHNHRHRQQLLHRLRLLCQIELVRNRRNRHSKASNRSTQSRLHRND